MPNDATAGELLRQWREHRGLSQLALAINAEISSRHLCFVETGRANASREMIVRLSEELQIPLRQRNVLLTAAGYAKIYPERALDDPALAVVGKIVQTILAAHEPNPAVAIDHQWRALAMNRTVELLLADVDPSLLQPPINIMRIGVHPLGLAPRIRNFIEWRTNAIAKLKQRIEMTADRQLIDLLKEVQSYRCERSCSKPAGKFMTLCWTLWRTSFHQSEVLKRSIRKKAVLIAEIWQEASNFFSHWPALAADGIRGEEFHRNRGNCRYPLAMAPEACKYLLAS